MLRRSMTLLVFALVFLFPAFQRPALAHHSTAQFSIDDITLRGTVVEYDWGNPHVVVVWDVKDNSGKVVRWTGELASVTSLLADGLTKNSLKPGDDVIMNVRPAKSGTPNGIISQIKRGDGTMVLRWSRQAGGSPQERAAFEAALKAESENK